jgi:hypothetical protein
MRSLNIKPSSFALCLAFFFAAATTHALNWIAPTAEELAATASTIAPGAGAEILYRFKQIDDLKYGAPATDEYIRIKIFNEKGVRQFDKVDIPYDDKNERIKSLSARVIKPGGAIVDVAKNAFYDRQMAKIGNIRLHVRSFSFPALEPGCIVEYKWTKTARSNIMSLKLDFMSDMPSRLVRFRIRPAELISGWRTEVYFYLCPEQPIRKESGGFGSVEMKNLPAIKSEPWMPPANDTQPWMLFYPTNSWGNAAYYWQNTAAHIHAAAEARINKPSQLVKSTALAVTRDATSDVERLDRINNYCKTTILNMDYYTPAGGLDDKTRRKTNRSLDEIIQRKIGDTTDIQVLFMALARVAGIEAHMALCANRSHGTFDKEMPFRFLLPDDLIATKPSDDDLWRFYDPARRLVNTGMLRWNNYGTLAFVALPEGYIWVRTPEQTPAHTHTRRTGAFKLDGEGTLSGDVKIEYKGHVAIEVRESFDLESQQKIEEMVRESVQERLPGAEVADVCVANLEDLSNPLELTYNIKVAGYAERAGQRLFLQPGFFTKGAGALFTDEKRTHNIDFHYASKVDDEVSISLPPRFTIEEGSSPADVTNKSWGYHKVDTAYNKTTNTIIYKRGFEFSQVRVSALEYAKIKRLFDIFAEHDAHALTLREERRE